MLNLTYKVVTRVIFGLLLTVIPPAFAQESPATPPVLNVPTITTNSDATLIVQPDQAQLEIGVVTQAPTADEAGSKNRVKLDAVLTALRKLLGSESDIKTTSYTLNPNYHYPKEGGNPTITSYTATNVLQLKITSLDLIGNAIDTATHAGANNVNNLQFTLRDEQAARVQALRMAALKAQTRANALAQALGLTVVRVLSVSQDQSEVQPFMMALTARKGTPTPIVPGTIEVRAAVTLKVQAAPQQSVPPQSIAVAPPQQLTPPQASVAIPQTAH
ncbi:MAG: SIMPL domain-containing protein [Gammaproteobacteria bacterium]